MRSPRKSGDCITNPGGAGAKVRGGKLNVELGRVVNADEAMSTI